VNKDSVKKKLDKMKSLKVAV
jgi:hypothetical protein